MGMNYKVLKPVHRDKFSRQWTSLISHLHPWRLWLLRALPKIDCLVVKLQQPTQGCQEMLCHQGLRMIQWQLEHSMPLARRRGSFNLHCTTKISSSEKVVVVHGLRRPKQAKQMKERHSYRLKQQLNPGKVPFSCQLSAKSQVLRMKCQN